MRGVTQNRGIQTSSTRPTTLVSVPNIQTNDPSCVTPRITVRHIAILAFPIEKELVEIEITRNSERDKLQREKLQLQSQLRTRAKENGREGGES